MSVLLYSEEEGGRKFHQLREPTQSLVFLLAGEKVRNVSLSIKLLAHNIKNSGEAGQRIGEIAQAIRDNRSYGVCWQDGLALFREALLAYHPESFWHTGRARELVLFFWYLVDGGDFLKVDSCGVDGFHDYFLGAGFSRSDWSDLAYAALYHDLGKLGFESGFWDDGEFTETQYLQCQMHPKLFLLIGEMLAVPSQITALAVLHHYLTRKYPGNGLVSGLSTFLADAKFMTKLEILSSVDVADGCMGVRTWRDGKDLSFEQTVEIMASDFPDVCLSTIPFFIEAKNRGKIGSIYAPF